jgi:hypothetical protein
MEKVGKYIGNTKSKDLSYYSIIFIPPSADKTNDSIARDIKELRKLITKLKKFYTLLFY